MIYAGTSRPDGGVGYPGGKRNPGESPRDTAIREATEEGWVFSWVGPTPVHVADVNGKRVWWFAGCDPEKLRDFKEKGRIKPVWLSTKKIRESGHGNEGTVL